MLVAPVITYPHTMYSVQAVSGGSQLWLPNPDTESGKGIISTMVNAGRNASAIVTAQKIGRDQGKTELSWTYVNKDEWETLMAFFDSNFFFKFNCYNPVSSSRVSRKFYVGDRTYQPWNVGTDGIPLAYKSCTLNVIDTGEGT